jgi:SAM-dependent methyltransferase
VAELYERARPGYPDDAVAFLAKRLRLEPGRTVVDIGAGTGKLTRALVGHGARVVAVEPLGEMRAQLERAVPEAVAVDGTAESIPLADGEADAVTAAQAAHWFDLDRALPELHRVLAADGLLALVWNSRDLDDPLQARVEELVAPYREAAPLQLDRQWRRAVEESPLFGSIELTTFAWAQSFTADDLADRVATTSVIAALSDRERTAVLDRVKEAAGALDEPFPFRYVTEVFLIPRSSDRPSNERGTSNQG